MENVIKGWFNERQRAHASVLRDLLIEIYRRTPCDLVFKGGTAVSFFYGSDRFSSDLDFSSKGIDDYVVIDDALESFGSRYPYKILNNWEDEVEQPSRKFRRYFLSFKYGAYEGIGVTIDYSISDCILEPGKHDLGNDYYLSKVDVMEPEEILAEKVATIYSRQKGRDLYDLYYLSVVRKTRIGGSLIAEKLASDKGLKGLKYSFASFKERIEGMRGYWKDLDGILNGFGSMKFDTVKDAVLQAFRNI